MQADLGTLHPLVYWAVFTMSWASIQSLYKIHTERGGCTAAPSGRRRLTGVDTITMSISSCASGDTIHTLSGCMFPPAVTGDQNTLMGFLWADKETETERVEKGGTGIEELSACCCTVIYPISALVTTQTERSSQWRYNSSRSRGGTLLTSKANWKKIESKILHVSNGKNT